MTRTFTAFLLLILLFTTCNNERKESDKTQSPINKAESNNASQMEGPLRPSFNINQVIEAAFNGDHSMIKDALNNGFDVNSTDNEAHTALMMAAFNGHSEIIKLLLEKGAKVDMKDLHDRTALMYASTGPANDCVIMLLEAGAEPNLVDNEEHFTALMFAAAEGQAEVVRTLLSHGADKDMVDIDGESAYDFALNNSHMEVVKLLK